MLAPNARVQINSLISQPAGVGRTRRSSTHDSLGLMEQSEQTGKVTVTEYLHIAQSTSQTKVMSMTGKVGQHIGDQAD